ncbi:hypothetical protein Dda_8895 [Drechslerella dactyloides]|uniref:C2H2-type domain-containing protein n=1 Tax=Drechslerella dactyloides TaxID=74499 RepID=A0AAD6IRU3_DREDA|nr:hypothetical protein Dda_8895 [Drechslerella dactyloides]
MNSSKDRRPPQKDTAESALNPCEICRLLIAREGTNRFHQCKFWNDDYARNRYKETASPHRDGNVILQNLPSAPFTCLDCQEDFYDEEIFNGHLVEHELIRRTIDRGMRTGKPTTGGRKIFICEDCRRDFRRRSGENSISTPPTPRLNATCLRTFRLLAGLICHLESGVCKNRFNQNTINRLICERDTEGLITLLGVRKLLEDHSSIASIDEERAISAASNCSSGVPSTPSYGSDFSFEMVSEAPDAGYDGRYVTSILGIGYRTQFPHSDHGTTKQIGPTLPYLSQELRNANSSYTTSRFTDPFTKFKTLSALAMHLEKGKCIVRADGIDVGSAMLGELAEELGFGGVGGLAAAIGGKLEGYGKSALMFAAQ